METLSGLRLHVMGTRMRLRDLSDHKYFIALIIWCRTCFEYLIFGYHCASEIFSTPKFP